MSAMRALLVLLLLALPAQAQAPLHGGPIRALAVAADGTIATGGFDQSVILWPARTILRWHEGAVAAVIALPAGGFASAGEDARIALWQTGPVPIHVLEGHTAPIAALAAHGDILASAGWDATVRLWPPSGETRVFTGHTGPVTALAFLPDGTLASAGYDGTIRLWPTGQILADTGLPLNALIALPDGTLAAGGADGAIRLLGRDPRTLPASARPIAALAATRDGATLAAASLGGAVTLWSLAEGRLIHTLDGPGLPVWSLGFAPDGATLWTGGADRQLRRWDVATGRGFGPFTETPDAPHPAAFRACSACHTLTPGGPAMAGPTLAGILGRRMGTLPGYRYSERLARGDTTWTRETIADLFTRGPETVLPGTRMPEQVVSDPEDLAALLDYLEAASR
ncbi:c-type cytochrome [Plastoroseomonas arctica]|nr:c-type cytochrome [Plastoroseomonas arctica]